LFVTRAEQKVRTKFGQIEAKIQAETVNESDEGGSDERSEESADEYDEVDDEAVDICDEFNVDSSYELFKLNDADDS
jgi:hypothetical protein